MKMYMVSIDIPRYRLDNNRAIDFHEDYIIENELPENLFSSNEGIESDAAQAWQHEILINEVIEPSSKQYKEELKIQTEPIVIMSDGAVLSGNSRLAYWRHLYNLDKTKYENLKYIEIAFYDTNDKELVFDFEFEEDLKPNIKNEYKWFARGRMIKQKLDACEFESQRKALRTKYKNKLSTSVAKINELVVMREYCDEFLSRYQEVRFKNLTNSEYVFKALAEVKREYEKYDLHSELIMAKEIIFKAIRRSSVKNKEGKTDYDSGVNAYKTLKDIKIIENGRPVVLEGMLKRMEKERRQKKEDLIKSIKIKKPSKRDEVHLTEDIYTALDDVKKERDLLNWKDKFSRANKRFKEGFDRYITMEEPSLITGKTKDDIEELKQLVDVVHKLLDEDAFEAFSKKSK